jgi:hypothetical protein
MTSDMIDPWKATIALLTASALLFAEIREQLDDLEAKAVNNCSVTTAPCPPR